MKNIKAIIFDAYGTLFDVNSAAEKCKDKIGDKWEAFANYWRTNHYTPSPYALRASERQEGLIDAYLHDRRLPSRSFSVGRFACNGETESKIGEFGVFLVI